MNPAFTSHRRLSSSTAGAPRGTNLPGTTRLTHFSAPRKISACFFPGLALPTRALRMAVGQGGQCRVGEVRLLLASVARCPPGSRMGLSMRKLWSPHLAAAKLCCQTPHLSAAVRQPRAGQYWLSPVLITPAPPVARAPGAAAPSRTRFYHPLGAK